MADPVTIGLLAGTALQAGGAIQAGNAAKRGADFEAAQLQRNAMAQRAMGTRQAFQQRQEGATMMSNARAAIAAGGGSTTDAGSMEMLADISEMTDYNVLAALYDSESKAQGLDTEAAVKKYEGKLARQQGRMKALTTTLTGASQAFGGINLGGSASAVNASAYKNANLGPTSGFSSTAGKSWGLNFNGGKY